MQRILLILILATTTLFSQSQTELSYYLPQNAELNPAIPTPQSVIDHNVGEWHITHDKLAEYMKALANASDRITIEDRGKTFEGRPLLLLTITASENHKNLDAIQSEHIEATESNSANAKNRPIVVYQGFSIHGNEPSGSNAALLVAYYLAAAEGAEIDDLLKNTIILFDPSLNPDGLQRFAYWANTNKNINLNPDPNDREYSEVWPGSRTNHYWFDMNRDWLPVQLPESRARIETFHNWMPNILTDHHEMGTNASFFFQPGIPSRTHPLTPQLNQDLTKGIATYHAKALDKIGSLYYSEESFDDFYYGKGSTFPDINGGIGILFEQASSRGHVQESENGLLTFPFTIKNQYTAAFSTLAAANGMRKDILEYQHNFFKNARAEASKEGENAIVFGDEKDAAKTYHLAEILKRHRIIFHDLKSDFSEDGKNYKKGYSYVVPKNQKNTRLINAMFEKRTTFQDSLFYDISAWTFPLAFNLDYTETTTANAGDEVTNLEHLNGGVNSKSEYAYLFEWHEYYSPKLLNSILKKGLRAKVALKRFKANGKSYDYGTIMIPAKNQDLTTTEIYNFLNEAAQESHIKIDVVSTGLNEGIDLGSRNFSNLELPKIALLVGDGITSYDAGEIWHLFDTRYDIVATKLDTKSISRADLSRYNTIIMVNSNSGLDENNTKKLQSWIKEGGTLVAYKNALKWLNSKKLMTIDFKKSKLVAKNISYEERRDFRGAQVIGGAIFETELDRSHPINFGYKNDKLAVFRNSTLFINEDKNSYNNPIQYSKNPLLSGYISEQNLDSISKSVPFKIGKIGRGNIIGFTDNTNFRAFWYGTNKLLMNAIFFREEM
ncbi:Secreted protein containing N-terminal Zinc-dependent carboxypeptidase related domain-like protein [Winogradskyella psychrotolerans RS-3]|uniref:Secreted protein containing N-terminal Zinc-dependent carboxypeptidase related domain-like protein n=1 Tax=Winogradskyella psychrotolerans RS-3 TaxID=641526 RepID=S7VY90_9FLAO|nr:M14 metallopeptidase family protein [Winogradskyella psychrotolerans]EPR74407.1 Secreted protein containing N-terminal Zinc-dependent carboxypeptidase related domain-like protein [Winogradskyella psychrotolerans RS-3]